MKPNKQYVRETLNPLLFKYGFGYKEIYLELGEEYLIVELIVFKGHLEKFETIISAYAYALKDLKISVFDAKNEEHYFVKHIKIEQF